MISPDASPSAPRPWRQLVFFGFVFGIALALTLTSHGMALLTHSVELWVDDDAPKAQIILATVHGERILQSGELRRRGEKGPFEGASAQGVPITGIVLIGSPAALDRITRVTLGMGKRKTLFDQEQFRKQWPRWDGKFPEDAPAGSEGRVYRTPLSAGESRITVLNHAINYEGDDALARYVLLGPPFLLYVLSFLALLSLRALVPDRLFAALDLTTVAVGDANAPRRVEKHAWVWLPAGLAVLIAAGGALELQHPYYFTQDDNFAQFLPNIMYGGESLSAGAFPAWNPHQYLGAPLAEIGTYALTYPLTYLSYWTATDVLNDRYATLEVFCCLHLLLGYFACRWLGRRLGLSAPLASAFGLSQVLSGYALVAGRSWYYMTPIYLWVPLLLIALLRLRERAPTLRWTIATGLVIGFFFHAGNAQMWIYAMSLAGIFALWSCLNRSLPWLRLVQSIPAGLIGLGIAAVLLVPQYVATRNLQRSGGEGWDVTEGLLSVFAFYPTPVVVDPANQREQDDPDHFGTMYHAGSVFTMAWLAVLLLVVGRQDTLRRVFRDPWMGLAALTFVLTLGDLGKLWTWQASLPIFEQFNHPHKFLPFFHFFSCSVGAVFVNRALRLTRRQSLLQAATFLVVAILLLHHACLSRSAFFLYAESPYPELPGELSGLRCGAARIIPLTFKHSRSAHYVVGLQHNFPTVYGISSFGGYDPLVEQGERYGRVLHELNDDPRSTVRKHGVTHLVLHREVADALKKRDWVSYNWNRLPASLITLVADCENATPVMQTEFVRVYELKDPTPIAYSLKQAKQMLPVSLEPAGVDADVSSLTTDQDVALNFLWRPGIRVYADGNLVPTREDDEQHIVVAFRAGTKNLAVRYESPWGDGLLLGSVLVLTGLCGGLAMKVASRRFN